MGVKEFIEINVDDAEESHFRFDDYKRIWLPKYLVPRKEESPYLFASQYLSEPITKDGWHTETYSNTKDDPFCDSELNLKSLESAYGKTQPNINKFVTYDGSKEDTEKLFSVYIDTLPTPKEERIRRLGTQRMSGDLRWIRLEAEYGGWFDTEEEESPEILERKDEIYKLCQIVGRLNSV